MDFHGLARKELQALCKKNKIPANMTNVAMADALAALPTVEGIEDISNNGPEEQQNVSKTPGTRAQRNVASVQNDSESTLQVTRTTRRRKDQEEEEEKNDHQNPSESEVPETSATRTGRRRATGTMQKKIEIQDEEGKDGKEENVATALPDTPAAQTGRRRATGTIQKKFEIQDDEGKDGKEEDVATALPDTPAARTGRRRATQKKVEIQVEEGKEGKEKENVATALPDTPATRTGRRRATQKKVEIQVEEGKEGREKENVVRTLPDTPAARTGRRRATQKNVEIQTEEGKDEKEKENVATTRAVSTRRSTRLVSDKKTSETVPKRGGRRSEAINISVLSEEESENVAKNVNDAINKDFKPADVLGEDNIDEDASTQETSLIAESENSVLESSIADQDMMSEDVSSPNEAYCGESILADSNANQEHLTSGDASDTIVTTKEGDECSFEGSNANQVHNVEASVADGVTAEDNSSVSDMVLEHATTSTPEKTHKDEELASPDECGFDGSNANQAHNVEASVADGATAEGNSSVSDMVLEHATTSTPEKTHKDEELVAEQENVIVMDDAMTSPEVPAEKTQISESEQVVEVSNEVAVVCSSSVIDTIPPVKTQELVADMEDAFVNVAHAEALGDAEKTDSSESKEIVEDAFGNVACAEVLDMEIAVVYSSSTIDMVSEQKTPEKTQELVADIEDAFDTAVLGDAEKTDSSESKEVVEVSTKKTQELVADMEDALDTVTCTAIRGDAEKTDSSESKEVVELPTNDIAVVCSSSAFDMVPEHKTPEKTQELVADMEDAFDIVTCAAFIGDAQKTDSSESKEVVEVEVLTNDISVVPEHKTPEKTQELVADMEDAFDTVTCAVVLVDAEKIDSSESKEAVEVSTNDITVVCSGSTIDMVPEHETPEKTQVFVADMEYAFDTVTRAEVLGDSKEITNDVAVDASAAVAPASPQSSAPPKSVNRGGIATTDEGLDSNQCLESTAEVMKDIAVDALADVVTEDSLAVPCENETGSESNQGEDPQGTEFKFASEGEFFGNACPSLHDVLDGIELENGNSNSNAPNFYDNTDLSVADYLIDEDPAAADMQWEAEVSVMLSSPSGAEKSATGASDTTETLSFEASKKVEIGATETFSSSAPDCQAPLGLTPRKVTLDSGLQSMVTPLKPSNKKATPAQKMTLEVFDDMEANNNMNLRSSSKVSFIIAEEKENNKVSKGEDNAKNELNNVSLRQLRIMFKTKLNIRENKNQDKEKSKMEKTRPALQNLEDNCIVGGGEN